MLNTRQIDESIKSLVLEVTKQIERSFAAVQSKKEFSVNKVISQDNLIDNLKSTVENACYDLILRLSPDDQDEMNRLRAINTIAANLERIGDYSVNIISQIQHFKTKNFIDRFEYEEFYKVILETLPKIVEALKRRELNIALKICKSEFRLDELYKTQFEKVISEFKNEKGESENLITSLFIFHYLERMGDCILNIGEAIIFTVLGEKLKIHQFEGLEENVNEWEGEVKLQDLKLESIWGTRSGCRISRIFDEDTKQEVIFKEGDFEKLKKEKKNIGEWEKIEPGLTPKVIGFNQHDEQSGSILLEALKGDNFKETILSGVSKEIDISFIRITDTVEHLWEKTLTKRIKEHQPDIVKQLSDRIGDVLRVHPSFRLKQFKIGELESYSLTEMLSKLQDIEVGLQPKFLIRLHGDFNIDNIIFNKEKNKIHYIDLYRSRTGDYVQDISVFLVSCFRIPFQDAEIRSQLNKISVSFFYFASIFAEKHKDESFQARLALGLIRSFITSTRFEYNKRFAANMFKRANYLMKKLIQNGSSWEKFKIPEEILTY